MAGFSTPAAVVTKLSELTIDADKDWQGKGISNIGTVVVTDGAGHYLELPSLTTAQRDALTPSTGMTIWNSDNARVEKYNGATWDSMGIAGVTVRKNTQMPVLGIRPQLNFIEGAAIDLNLEDNPPDDEIDITISARYPTRFMLLVPDDAALPAAGGAALSSIDGTNFSYECLDYDPGSEEAAFWEWFLTPDYLSENIVVDILWQSAGAGDAKFGFSVLGREKGEDWDVAMGVERTVVTTNLGAGKMNKSRISTFAPGWSPSDVLLFKLARKAGDAADTIDANDVRVLKVIVSYTGKFAQAFYPLAVPVQLSLLTSDAWTDMDLSAYVPAGATGVILHFTNDWAGAAREIGLRKKGSTDDRKEFIGGTHNTCHSWAMIGLDENRTFQYYVGDHNNQRIWLVGYTSSAVVFFDNAYEKVPAGFASYQDIDVSAECPNAIGVIVEFTTVGAYGENVDVRKNGSTLDTHWGTLKNHGWAIVGCDGAQVFEAYLADANAKMFVVGYILEGAVFPTNKINKTPGTVDTWLPVDCSAQAPSGIMIFFLCEQLGDYGVRKPGLTGLREEDLYNGAWAFVACDSMQKVEAIVDNLYSPTNIGLWLVGYATWAGA